MKKYLLFGGGVNSTALYVLLKKTKTDVTAIYVDTGGDPDSTRKHIEHMHERGYPIEIIPGQVNGVNLPQYIETINVIPSRRFRWCTDKFKIRPIMNHIEKPAELYIAFDYGEKHRAKESERKNVYNRYPLIEEKVTREQCREIIRWAGLPVPTKSGCWFCPFQPMESWANLYFNDTEKFSWCICRENMHVKRMQKLRSKPTYWIKKPLVEHVRTGDIFRRRTPTGDKCICEVE